MPIYDWRGTSSYHPPKLRSALVYLRGTRSLKNTKVNSSSDIVNINGRDQLRELLSLHTIRHSWTDIAVHFELSHYCHTIRHSWTVIALHFESSHDCYTIRHFLTYSPCTPLGVMSSLLVVRRSGILERSLHSTSSLECLNQNPHPFPTPLHPPHPHYQLIWRNPFRHIIIYNFN